jgi:hypothetical protein
MTEVAVFWTIAVSTLAWSVAECCRLLAWHLAQARLVWSAGLAAMLVHSIAAFVVLYGGTQAVALAATAQQTAALTGVDSGAGLYVNYAFVALWLADAAWWWSGPAARGRIAGLGWARLAVFLFMFVNGAVIFADGGMRWLGTAAVGAVAAAALTRLWRSRANDLMM